MAKRIQHLLVDTEEMSENSDTILEVIDEISSDGKREKLPPDDLKIREVLTENINFVTDFAKKTGDYSSLSPTDIQVLALAYQIDKEMEMEDHLMTMTTEPTMQGTITVTELPKDASNPENKDDVNENEEFTKPKKTEPPKQPASDWPKTNIPGDEEAKQGADWSAIKSEGSNAVHLDEQNLIGDNFDDQKLADIADLLKKMDLRDGYDVDHFKPDKYTDDEDSDSDFLDSDYDTDGEDPYYSLEKLAEKKEEIHMVEFEDEAVEAET